MTNVRVKIAHTLFDAIKADLLALNTTIEKNEGTQVTVLRKERLNAVMDIELAYEVQSLWNNKREIYADDNATAYNKGLIYCYLYKDNDPGSFHDAEQSLACYHTDEYKALKAE
mgnify:CR=1 FL=1